MMEQFIYAVPLLFNDILQKVNSKETKKKTMTNGIIMYFGHISFSFFAVSAFLVFLFSFDFKVNRCDQIIWAAFYGRSSVSSIVKEEETVRHVRFLLHTYTYSIMAGIRIDYKLTWLHVWAKFHVYVTHFLSEVQWLLYPYPQKW